MPPCSCGRPPPLDPYPTTTPPQPSGGAFSISYRKRRTRSLQPPRQSQRPGARPRPHTTSSDRCRARSPLPRSRRAAENVHFFFNDTATTEIYTLSLHDALPIHRRCEDSVVRAAFAVRRSRGFAPGALPLPVAARSEEHTSELQSHSDLVCRLLLEKKKKKNHKTMDKNRHKQSQQN